MGKPYQNELDLVPSTIDWALKQDISGLRHTLLHELGPYNLVAVGSGGSLVAAEYAALLHESSTGYLARSATPLEATVRATPRNTAALLLSARGSNADILQAARLLPELGYENTAALCARMGSPLGAAISDQGGTVLEFGLPSGRDGFLATNSLIATLVLLYRASMEFSLVPKEDDAIVPGKVTIEGTETTLENRTLIVLGQGWAVPAAMDFETRFSEAALANVSFTDPRNFAHGRHNWLSLHAADTGIVSLETQSSEAEATRMLKLLPEEINTLRVKSGKNGPAATIDLVASVMALAGSSARAKGIDPGRPPVPKFGRRLYRAGAARYGGPREAPPVSRKRKALFLSPHENREEITTALNDFVHRLKNTSFAGLVIDYDGTLCGRNQRFESLTEDIGSELNRLLGDGIPIGVASGRGGSLKELLREAIAPDHWDRVVIGLYNGARVGKLCDEPSCQEQPIPGPLAEARSRLSPIETALGLQTIVRPHQISIRPTTWVDPVHLRTVIIEQLADFEGVSVLASSHSVDIVSKCTSKSAVVDALHMERPGCILRIGDQGAAGGNDFELLNSGLSLSVDRVSSNLNTCWNLGRSGVSGPRLTLQYLRALSAQDGSLRVDTSRPPFGPIE